MKLIVEDVDGENYVEIVLSNKELEALADYDFLTKQKKMFGKWVCFAIRRTTKLSGEDEDED